LETQPDPVHRSFTCLPGWATGVFISHVQERDDGRPTSKINYLTSLANAFQAA
jgi:hypothetical protein